MFGFGRKPYLSPEAEKRIVSAINRVEQFTRAEIRVHLAAKVKTDVYQEAVEVFRKLGMYRTELRSAVLIYVVPSERKFAIVGDIGIHQKVTDVFWNSVRDSMSEHFAHGDLADGIVNGVEMAGTKLNEYFPLNGSNPNELSNDISRSR